MYCRHCTRRRFAGTLDKHRTQKELEMALHYIRSHSEIRDVLLSGGDPLTLSDAMLEYLLCSLRQIPHVEIIRSVPDTCGHASANNPELVAMIRKYHPVWVNTHFNHPKELTPPLKKPYLFGRRRETVGNQSYFSRN
jgi:lysine 2,3-aminomutase